jgi:hypothetical protein
MARLYRPLGGHSPKDVARWVSAQQLRPYLTVLRLCCEEPRSTVAQICVLRSWGGGHRLSGWLSSLVPPVASLRPMVAATVATACCCSPHHRLFLSASACAFAGHRQCSKGVPVLVVVSEEILFLCPAFVLLVMAVVCLLLLSFARSP